ncbi:MAG TPA: hypothetical protein VGY32_11515 [Solirubrobacteraceae bacterium]|jgi:hypothetical protein|nr:hypothetical protein [Solirubrobacteraceae bacterium]
MHVSNEVLAALIGLVGTVLSILAGRLPKAIEKRIRGLVNGKKSRALEEIDRLYEERQRKGLPLRRTVDRIVEEEQHE